MYLGLSGFADTLLGLLLGWPLAPGSVSLTGTGPFSVTKVGDSHLLSHGLSRPCHWPDTDHRAGLGSWSSGEKTPHGARYFLKSDTCSELGLCLRKCTPNESWP